MKTQEGQSTKNITSIISIMVLVLAVFFFRAWFNDNVLGALPYALRIAAYYVLWWIILIPIFLFMRRDKEKLSDLGFTAKKLPVQILIGLVLGLATSFAYSWIVTLLDLRQSFFGITEGKIPAMGSFVYNLFETVVLVALVEETIFRGYLYKKMIDVKNSSLLAIVVTALLFGFMHIVNRTGVLGILSPMAFGFIYGFCRAYLKNCSLVSLVLAHGIHNILVGQIAFGIMDLF
ncbi:MAG: CPBP family intramembrane metalloprotease [Peptococcaceae bacterium]|nr:CPBP family intramembrane metalloprotease [Peptococcaceae bacterium]